MKKLILKANLKKIRKKPRKKSKFQKKPEELQRKQEQQLKNRKKKIMKNLIILVLFYFLYHLSLVFKKHKYTEKKIVLSIKISLQGNCPVYKVTFYSDGTEYLTI